MGSGETKGDRIEVLGVEGAASLAVESVGSSEVIPRYREGSS